jgi:hypothetical protein
LYFWTYVTCYLGVYMVKDRICTVVFAYILVPTFINMFFHFWSAPTAVKYKINIFMGPDQHLILSTCCGRIMLHRCICCTFNIALLKLALNTNQWINRSINLFTQLYQNHSLSRVSIKSGLYLDFILSNVVTFYTERVVTNHASVFLVDWSCVSHDKNYVSAFMNKYLLCL